MTEIKRGLIESQGIEPLPLGSLINELEVEENGKRVTYKGAFALMDAYYDWKSDGSSKYDLEFHISGIASLSKWADLPRRRTALRFWPPGIVELNDPVKTEFRREWLLIMGSGVRGIGFSFVEPLFPDKFYIEYFKDEAEKYGIILDDKVFDVFKPLEKKLEQFYKQLDEKKRSISFYL